VHPVERHSVSHVILYSSQLGTGLELAYIACWDSWSMKSVEYFLLYLTEINVCSALKLRHEKAPQFMPHIEWKPWRAFPKDNRKFWYYHDCAPYQITAHEDRTVNCSARQITWSQSRFRLWVIMHGLVPEKAMSVKGLIELVHQTVTNTRLKLTLLSSVFQVWQITTATIFRSMNVEAVGLHFMLLQNRGRVP